MENMTLYNRFASVPKEAQKTIGAGRLKGMTDINPMWRIRCLTEAFGPCGIGWKAPITERWIDVGANGECVANVRIDLQYITENGWSEPIEGLGGAMFTANEKNGLHTSDEAFKMAYTDAISVACKMLGIGADVYWSAGRSKYTEDETRPQRAEDPLDKLLVCDYCGKVITTGSPSAWASRSRERYGKVLCLECMPK